MKIREILRGKGRTVVTIDADRTVLEAVRLLVERNIGSLVVTRGDRLAGIITERDILRLTADRCHEIDSIVISEVMTEDVVTANLDDRIGHVMEVMTENRIRHLPVLSDGSLAGLLSIGDVVNSLRESVQSENHHLKEYIQGTVY